MSTQGQRKPSMPAADDLALTGRAMSLQENAVKLQSIEKLFTGNSEPLVAHHRQFLRETILRKLCRKGSKPRHFFLCSDIVVYGTILGKRLTNQAIIPLARAAVSPLDDDDARGYRHAFQISSERKSFIVCANTEAEKEEWVGEITRLQEVLAAQNKVDEVVEWATLWVPDKLASECMVCLVSKFSALNRRHHCRRCGRVVCGLCSSHSVELDHLPGKKKHRVCDTCFVEIQTGGSGGGGKGPAAGAVEPDRSSTVSMVSNELKNIDLSKCMNAVAISDFEPNAYETRFVLPLKVGDRVRVLEMDATGTWKGECSGKVGLFPSAHVKLDDESGSPSKIGGPPTGAAGDSGDFRHRLLSTTSEASRLHLLCEYDPAARLSVACDSDSDVEPEDELPVEVPVPPRKPVPAPRK